MTTYLCGRCEINLDRREVQVDGELRPVGPKVFGLLVLLLQQRHRIVSKAELVEQLWHGAALSASVLARTVMLARRAIDDGSARESPIRNLHGQGYRFIGDVQLVDGPPRQTAPLPRLMLALLPCTDSQQAPRPALAGQGFMAMVGDALRAGGVDTPPINEVLQADARLGSNLPEAERALLALHQLQCSHAVVTTVRSHDNALWMDYRVFNSDGQIDRGSLRDATMALLAGRLAQDLLRLLRSGPPAGGRASPADPFVSEALARAEELFAHERWADAEALYHAVSRLVPDDADVVGRRLACMLPLRDVRVPAVAGALLGHPRAKRRPELLSRAHLGLAMHLGRRDRGGAQAQARKHQAEAARLAGESGQGAWAVLWQVIESRQLLEAGEPERARAAALSAQADAQRHGHAQVQLMAQGQLALLETMMGDPLQALQRLQAVADDYLQQRRHYSAAAALAWSMLCSCELGLFNAATEQVPRVLGLVSGHTARGHLAKVLSQVALVLLDSGDSARLLAVLQQLESSAEPLANRPSAPLMATRGAVLVQQGQAAEGRALMEAALSVGALAEGPLFVRAWGLMLLRLCHAAGQWPQAKRVRDLLAQLSGHRDDPMLQSALKHAQACDAWRQGRVSASMVMLQQLIDEFPMTRAEAAARMDLAWMLLDMGQVQRAERLLAGCGAWRHQHPSGLAAQARLHHARGQHADAVQLQLQALRQHRGSPPALHSCLTQAYAEAAAGRSQPWVPLTAWVSLAWLPG